MQKAIRWSLILALAGAQVHAQFLPPIVIPPWLIGIFTGNAREVTQLANNAQLILTTANQVKQLKNEFDMLVDMGKNLKKVPVLVHSNVMPDIDQLDALIQTGQSLGYSVATIEAQFLNTFKGYVVPAGYGDRRNWLQTALDTSRGVLRLINEQSRQRAGTKSIMEQVRMHASMAEGRMSVLQTLSEVADQQAGQLQRLNTLLSADISAKQAYQSVIMQEKISAAASEERFFQTTIEGLGKPGFTATDWKPNP